MEPGYLGYLMLAGEMKLSAFMFVLMEWVVE